jgi:hypothetical protein
MSLILPHNGLIRGGGGDNEPNLQNVTYDGSTGSLNSSTASGLLILAGDGSNFWLYGSGGYRLWSFNPSPWGVASVSGAADDFRTQSKIGTGGGKWARNDPRKLYVMNDDDILVGTAITTDYGMFVGRTSTGGAVQPLGSGVVLYDFCWNDDGTEAFILTDDIELKAGTLSTPYDFTTWSTNASKDVDLQAVVTAGGGATMSFGPPSTISMSPGGTRMWHPDRQNNVVRQHAMSTPFDPSTATLEFSLDISSTVASSSGYAFMVDDAGQYAYLFESGANELHRWTFN